MKSLMAIAALSLLATSANAALLSRLGGQAYYDDVLDITWTADANLAATQTFGVAGISSVPATVGQMSWDTAQAWVAAMNSAGYLGVSTWRLPHMVDIDNDGCLNNLSWVGTDCGYNVVSTGPNASEMANLFYQTLGNLPFFDTSGAPQLPVLGIQHTGPFANLGNTLYWYDLETVSNAPQPDLATPDNAWYFGMPSGGQRPTGKVTITPMTAWAVMDGDIGAVVPVPAAAWTLGSALGLLGWLRRRGGARVAA